MIAIKGAVSFEAAHFIPDYPAGYTARVTKKMWVETKKGKGQRGVYATSAKGNPNRWCAPKANTYDDLCGIAIIEESDVVPGGKWTSDDVGHAIFVRVGSYGDVTFLERYNAMFGPFETESEAETMRLMLAMARAEERLGPRNAPGNYYVAEERDAVVAYDKERQKMRQQYIVEELAKIKASDEVPMPETAPVAPAQEVIPAGAMF
jgi:hypothetical protein